MKNHPNEHPISDAFKAWMEKEREEVARLKGISPDLDYERVFFAGWVLASKAELKKQHMKKNIQPYERDGKWFYVSPFSDRELEIRDDWAVAKLRTDHL